MAWSSASSPVRATAQIVVGASSNRSASQGPPIPMRRPMAWRSGAAVSGELVRHLPPVPHMTSLPQRSQLDMAGATPSSGSHSARAPLRRSPADPGVLRLLVATQRGAQVEVEVSSADAVGDVLQRLLEIAAASVGTGVAGPIGGRAIGDLDGARLLHRGVPLRQEASLESLGVRDGDTLRLMPIVRESRSGHVPGARRGMFMTPGSKPWAPSSARGPKELLLVDSDAPYSANLCHRDLIPHPPLPVPEKMGRRLVRPN